MEEIEAADSVAEEEHLVVEASVVEEVAEVEASVEVVGSTVGHQSESLLLPATPTPSKTI